MAITSTSLASDLIMVMDNGIGASGQPLSKNRIYKNVKTTAENEALYAIATGLSSLQQKEMLSIQRRDTAEIENDI